MTDANDPLNEDDPADEPATVDAEDEPDVADWANPTREETHAIFRRRSEAIARMLDRHPELEVFLNLALDAVRNVRSEGSANARIADAYYASEAQINEGLLKRLNEGGVSEQEANRIYDLLEAGRASRDDKTSEFVQATDRTGNKALIVTGGLIATGLTIAIIYKGRGPAMPPSFSA
ncbi:hypothetical protein [uncultured Microbacterium sp.]|uniref:hypothetical protein n=1 Tax=uncultured Microbacterium sp. TaxID=191216 RepID=UPI0025F0DC4E|nr:hypothetical protein [uncultured Microbacterium sp.]